jgi:hypothetical protein
MVLQTWTISKKGTRGVLPPRRMFTTHVHRCSWNIAFVYDVSKCSSWCYNIAILDDHDTIVCSVCLKIGICYMVLQTWTISKKGTRGLLPPRRMFTKHVHRCRWHIAYVYDVSKCSSWCYSIAILDDHDTIVCSVCLNIGICYMVLQTWLYQRRGQGASCRPGGCAQKMFIDVDEILHMFMMSLNVHPDAIILQY